MRIEDRLFDTGWVRSEFPKYFMASGRFLQGNFFKNYLGWRGQKKSSKISSGAKSEDDLEPSLTIQEFFPKEHSWFYIMQRMCTLFG